MANNLIRLEVLMDTIQADLGKKVAFLPYATRRTLNEQGQFVEIRSWEYIGDATSVGERQPLPLKDIKNKVKSIEIKKIGNMVDVSDEELMGTFPGLEAQIAEQLSSSIVNGMENSVVSALAAIGPEMTHAATQTKFDLDVIVDALAKFGEDQGAAVLFLNSADLTALRKDEMFITKSEANGIRVVGEIYGVTVVISDRVPAGEAYLMKQGALEIFMRREPKMERQRDMVHQVTAYGGTVHYVVHIAKPQDVIKITLA